jgi:hypothetical protein
VANLVEKLKRVYVGALSMSQAVGFLLFIQQESGFSRREVFITFNLLHREISHI